MKFKKTQSNVPQIYHRPKNVFGRPFTKSYPSVEAVTIATFPASLLDDILIVEELIFLTEFTLAT